MITIERGRGWTASQGRGTARAKAPTATPGRRPPAARLPAPAGRAATRGWPGSPAAAPRTRPRPPPSGRLALLIDELTGPERRCPGADADERAGLLRACAAAESWAAGAKLGVIREMMRCDGPAVARRRPRRPARDLVGVAAVRARRRAGLLDPVRRQHRGARLGARSAAARHRRPAARTGR